MESDPPSAATGRRGPRPALIRDEAFGFLTSTRNLIGVAALSGPEQRRRRAEPTHDIGTYGTNGASTWCPRRWRASNAELDELGYGAVWIPETVFREPFVHAALLMAASPRIKVATGIVNRYGRDPLAANAAMHTLNEAFPGRFLLGLGVSHEHLVAWVRKHDYSRPYSGMVEYLDAMAKARFFAPRGDPGAEVLAAPGRACSRSPPSGPRRPHLLRAASTLRSPRRWVRPLLAVEQMVVLDTIRHRPETARQHMAVYLSAPNYTNNLARLRPRRADGARPPGRRHRRPRRPRRRPRSDPFAPRRRGGPRVRQVLHPDMAHLPRRSGGASAALGLTG